MPSFSIYHWVTTVGPGKMDLTRKTVFDTGNEHWVIFSHEQKRYFIPSELKQYKEQIKEYIKHTDIGQADIMYDIWLTEN